MGTTTNRSPLERYAARGYRRVDGWLERDAVRIIRDAAEVQDAQGVNGSVAEIGIHHGKLFILLFLLAGPGGQGFACDLFDRQDENTDRSGRGDYERFLSNLDRHGCPRDAIAIHTGNSLELTPEAVSGRIDRPVRLFSIDGGHCAQVTRHDLSLAISVLCPGGIAIVDDYFREEWPGVSEGVMRCLIDHPGVLAPFAIGGNKILFTTGSERAAAYRESLEGIWRPWEYVTSEFLGSPVLVFLKRDRFMRRVKHSSLGSRLRGSNFAEWLRRWQRRLFGNG